MTSACVCIAFTVHGNAVAEFSLWFELCLRLFVVRSGSVLLLQLQWFVYCSATRCSAVVWTIVLCPFWSFFNSAGWFLDRMKLIVGCMTQAATPKKNLRLFLFIFKHSSIVFGTCVDFFFCEITVPEFNTLVHISSWLVVCMCVCFYPLLIFWQLLCCLFLEFTSRYLFYFSINWVAQRMKWACTARLQKS